MITIEEAKTRINNNTLTLKEERLALTDSLGFVLSKDIFSAINLPSFDQSAMDGYAVCFSDQIATNFKLVAEVKTGDTKPIQLKKGEEEIILLNPASPILVYALVKSFANKPPLINSSFVTL
ncbi:MAG: hypothetical protein CMC95_01885 [Flavobacteriales bacterium]|nr:hypothetical protein [Flavobacteriales bacterium]